VFEHALPDEAREQVAKIRTADIVVGIPSYRNARTITTVLRAVVKGIAEHYGDARTVLVNVDAHSFDGTANTFMSLRIPKQFLRFTTNYEGLTGHGSAVRAIFEVAAQLGAKACLVLEANSLHVQPDDVPALLDPILEGKAHLACPAHQWDDADAAFEDLIIYPMLRLMYRQRLRRALPGDWGVSGQLARGYATQDVWETDVARSGLDMWMTVMALVNGVTIVQVPSFRKTCDLVFGSTAYEHRFSHTVGTLLRHLSNHQRLWRSKAPTQEVPSTGPAPSVVRADSRPVEDYTAGFREGIQTSGPLLRRILRKDDWDALERMLDQPVESFAFPDDLWARILVDFGVCFNKAEMDPDKVASSLSIPFYARSLALWNEIDRLGIQSYEDIIERQALALESAREYLIEKWDTFVAWAPDAPIR